MGTKRDFWQFLSTTLGRLLLLAIVVLFLINIGRSIYKNYQMNKQLDAMEAKIAYLKDENINLQNKILYYQTNTYKELELRQHLGYKKPDEKVIVLDKTENNREEIIFSNQQSNQAANKNKNTNQVDTIPNWQKWWDFIFG